jgi:hypothetical protein
VYTRVLAFVPSGADAEISTVRVRPSSLRAMASFTLAGAPEGGTRSPSLVSVRASHLDAMVMVLVCATGVELVAPGL